MVEHGPAPGALGRFPWCARQCPPASRPSPPGAGFADDLEPACRAAAPAAVTPTVVVALGSVGAGGPGPRQRARARSSAPIIWLGATIRPRPDASSSVLRPSATPSRSKPPRNHRRSIHQRSVRRLVPLAIARPSGSPSGVIPSQLTQPLGQQWGPGHGRPELACFALVLTVMDEPQWGLGQGS